MTKGKSIIERLYTMEGGPNECRSIYAQWANSYEEDTVEGLGYVAPRLVAEALSDLVSPEARVLDAGCGTGLVGQELAQRGFAAIDGLDLSDEMLSVAAQKSVYEQLAVADLTQAIALPSDRYDAVVSAGVFTNGHVGPSAFEELVRVARPGAPVVVTVHEDFWKAERYSERLAAMEERGLLHVKQVSQEPYHQKAGYYCRLCVLEAA